MMIIMVLAVPSTKYPKSDRATSDTHTHHPKVKHITADTTVSGMEKRPDKNNKVTIMIIMMIIIIESMILLVGVRL